MKSTKLILYGLYIVYVYGVICIFSCTSHGDYGQSASVRYPFLRISLHTQNS